MLLPEVGAAGQERLAAARVLIIGCGALGASSADQLARAGVGWLRIVDRDLVEETNLQRQVLFDEADARNGAPKAVAAAERLGHVNSSIRIEPVVADVHAGNIESLAGVELADVGPDSDGQRVDLILDGTDNVETRYLINDVAVKHGIPWVYGACVGVEGRVMVVKPGESPCLRCIFPDPPLPGELVTCDTAGVLAAAAMVVASLQVTEAIRLLVWGAGSGASAGDMRGDERLISVNLWKGRFHSSPLAGMKREMCPTCGVRAFEFLDRPIDGRSISLCGRDAVQVRPPGPAVRLDMAALARRLAGRGPVESTPFLLRCTVEGAAGQGPCRLTVFADGRAIIQGTRDPDRARSIYSRLVGS